MSEVPLYLKSVATAPSSGGGSEALQHSGGEARQDFFFFFITPGLELTDTKVYEP